MPINSCSKISRRKFVRSSTISAISFPFIASGLRANPPSERLRHASFGANGMAGADVGSLARSKHFDLVAVADVDLKRAEGIRTVSYTHLTLPTSDLV